MDSGNKLVRFENTMLPHSRSAYNLARWITGSDHDAEVVTQESYLRAFNYFERFRGTDSRSWLLAIVRNTCYSWLKRKKMHNNMTYFDENFHSPDNYSPNPENKLLNDLDNERIRDGIEKLPVQYREVLVLCDLEGLSYKEISRIIKLPIGTVMSRLSRARKKMIKLLGPEGERG